MQLTQALEITVVTVPVTVPMISVSNADLPQPGGPLM